mgnify:CR=1 FL=1
MRYLVVKNIQPRIWLSVASPFYFNTWSEAARWMLANGRRATCVIKEVA